MLSKVSVGKDDSALAAARNLLKQAEEKVGVKQAAPFGRGASRSGESAASGGADFFELIHRLTPAGESGKVVQLEGSRTMLMAWAGQISQAQGWCGVVGMPGFGWAQAAHMGMALERSLVVADTQLLADQVVSTLLEGCDVVLLGEQLGVGAQRRLAAKARSSRCHILTETAWHQPHYRVRAAARMVATEQESLGVIELTLAMMQQRYQIRVGSQGVLASLNDPLEFAAEVRYA